MKIMKKSRILEMKQVEHVANERDILATLEHPFIVKLLASFQDDMYLYLALELVSDGTLAARLRRVRRLDDDGASFYAAQLVSVLEHCHVRDVVYRDLKPENVLLASDGYAKLTDWGFAKVVRDQTYTLCGTPFYIAPEVLQNKGHGKPADCWSLGVLVYEMLVGYPPFVDEDRMQLYKKIISGHVAFPKVLSNDAKVLVRKLLTQEPDNRMGVLKAGAADVKAAKFFRHLDWDALLQKQIPPLHAPPADGEGDPESEPESVQDGPAEPGEPGPGAAEGAGADAFAGW